MRSVSNRLVQVAVFIAASLVIVLFCFIPTRTIYAGGREKGGAELWAANCRQCHTLRSPSSYSSDQWEIAVNHMRFRCGLTAKETRKIAEFLKNAD